MFHGAYWTLFALSAVVATVWVVRSWRGYGRWTTTASDRTAIANREAVTPQ